MKAVTIEKEGSIIGLFTSISNAARSIGITETAIRKRIAKGENREGETFRWATKEEQVILRKLKAFQLGDIPVKKNTVENKSKQDVKERGTKLKELDPDTEDNLDLLSEQYIIVSYELANGRVCITPCPYRDAPKPKIGSALCLSCGSFHGRNRVKQQVACGAAKKKVCLRP